MIAQHPRAWIAYRGSGSRLYCWRSKAGNEVDFVLSGPDIFAAFEVKRAVNLHRRNLRGLQAFRQDYPEAQAALIYLGKERLNVEDVPCLPGEEFLRSLHPGEYLPV